MKKLIITATLAFMAIAPVSAMAEESNCVMHSSNDSLSRTQQDLQDVMDQNTDGKIEAAQIDFDIQKANARIAKRLKQIDDLQNNMGVQGDAGEDRLEQLGQLETAALQKKKSLDAKLQNTFEPSDKRKVTLAAAQEIDRLYKNAVKISQ